MDLAFSPEEECLRADFARLLAAHPARAIIGLNVEDSIKASEKLWSALATDGWLSAGVPEEYGGSALPDTTLCLLAEELGRALSPTPFVASLAGLFILRAQNSDLQARWMPDIASGRHVCLLLTDADWHSPPQIELVDRRVRLHGHTLPIADLHRAGLLIARTISETGPLLIALRLSSDKVLTSHASLDLLHPASSIDCNDTNWEILTVGTTANQIYDDAVLRWAVMAAFEHIGGASAALDMACDYAKTRFAFGRPIGSFQAIKHTFADMLVSLDLARSNASFAAAALLASGEVLEEAACVARLSALDAYRQCARENIQIHGAIGVTWESDCHLHYRRSQAVGAAIGTVASWKERLVDRLVKQRRQLT